MMLQDWEDGSGWEGPHFLAAALEEHYLRATPSTMPLGARVLRTGFPHLCQDPMAQEIVELPTFQR